MTEPLLTEWTGAAFVPAQRHMKRCWKELEIGARYFVEPISPRSRKTHNHFFAWLHEAWLNLPDDLAEIYPSETHLRKRALIQAGLYNEEIVDAGSNTVAIRVAACLRKREEFALVIVRGAFVIIRTAKSQREAAMDGKSFAQAKATIMAVVADMIGVAPETIQQNAGQAA